MLAVENSATEDYVSVGHLRSLVNKEGKSKH